MYPADTFEQCPLCNRQCPKHIMQGHHLRTRREDKTLIENICRECHTQIHGLFPNQDLRDPRLGLDSVEGLLANEKFQAARRFIQKLTPGATMQVRDSKRKRRH